MKPSDIKYPGLAQKMFSTLTADGQAPDEAAAAMVAKGWAAQTVEALKATASPKVAPPAGPSGSPSPPPGPPTSRPSISAAPVPQAVSKWGFSSAIYREAAAAEINRLKAAGMTKEEVVAAMRKSGWR